MNFGTIEKKNFHFIIHTNVKHIQILKRLFKAIYESINSQYNQNVKCVVPCKLLMHFAVPKITFAVLDSFYVFFFVKFINDDCLSKEVIDVNIY